MKKAIYMMLCLTVMFSTNQSWATSNQVEKCAEVSKADLLKKLKSFSAFSKIDDDKMQSTFHKANLIHSMHSPQNDGSHLVAFVIKPAPILDNVLVTYPLETKDYPKFMVSCSFDEIKLSLLCKQLTQRPKHIVNDFALNVQSQTDPSCDGSNVRLNISYEIDVDENAYNSLIQKVKSTESFSDDLEAMIREIVDGMGDKDEFFQEYWDAFLVAWETDDWES